MDMEALLDHFEQAIGHRFKSPTRLLEALTHRSFANEHDAVDNERLEFLGDAVLGLCTSTMLTKTYPRLGEKELSRLRARLVNNSDLLPKIAVDLGIPEYLRVGRGEARDGGRTKPKMLADAVEALLGALYEEKDFRPCLRLVRSWLEEPMRELRSGEDASRLWIDPISELQHIFQRDHGDRPTYEVVATSGPAHALEFEVAVSFGGEELGRGRGARKKDANRAAAQQALSRVRSEP